MIAQKQPGTFNRPEDRLPAPRVLIVDDNLTHSTAIKRGLRDPSSKIGQIGAEIDVVDDLAAARPYLNEDSIDVYVLDLEVTERAGEGLLDISIGKKFVEDVVRATNAGIVICSTFAAETEAAELLDAGADDYVEKAYSAAGEGDLKKIVIPNVLAARVYSVWRRTLQSRQDASKAVKLAHVGRVFTFSGWRFVVGNRTLTDLQGNEVKLSPTEHAFLRYLMTVEDHSINSEIFNIEVLDRDQHKAQIRLDNFIYRLRLKLRNRIELSTQGSGVYKLLDLRELKPML